MQLPSRLLEDAVHELSRFPGVGKKSALRMVLYLLRKEPEASKRLGDAILNLREKICFCNICHNVSDTPTCSICHDASRETDIICVVEDLRDVLALEQTGHYRGLYHVLGGLIAPIDGIGPENLYIESLLNRVKVNQIKEIILAFSATVEGDTTSFYLTRKLNGAGVQLSTLSKGISVGGSLEFADEVTLARSLAGRTKIHQEE